MKRFYEDIGVYVMLIVLAALITFSVFPVSAATPTYPECPQVATAGGIKIYYCDDTIVDDPFYINQLGWMMPKPY